MVQVKEQKKKCITMVGGLSKKKSFPLNPNAPSVEHGSPEFDAFLNAIGRRVKLKGFPGYRGGLDTNGMGQGLVDFI